jgi:hypothetical protein
VPLTNSKQLLDFLLEGGRIEPGAVEALIVQVKKEDLYLDYKDGRQPAKKLRNVVRKWVTGFANADGGTLALGISEPKRKSDAPRRVVGIEVPDEGDAERWANSVLLPFAGRLSPPLRYGLTKHPDGDVLFIATGRAPQLIPYAEGPKYALRVGDSTVDADPYLVGDLLLGRRNHPIINVRSIALLPGRPEGKEIRPHCLVILENHGFVTGEEVEVGTVSWAFVNHAGERNPSVLQFIDGTDAPAPWSESHGNDDRAWKISRFTADGVPPTLKPFHASGLHVSVGPFPYFGGPCGGKVTFALYTMPTGSMPQWYEVTCSYRCALDDANMTIVEGAVTFEPRLGRTPALTWSKE